MFVPNIRPILQAHKQAQELCKPGLLGAAANNCPSGEFPPPSTAGRYRPLLAAISVPFIFGLLYFVYVIARRLRHIHHMGTRSQGVKRLRDHVPADDADEEDQRKETCYSALDAEMRIQQGRDAALRKRQAIRQKWIARNDKSWLSDESSTSQESISPEDCAWS